MNTRTGLPVTLLTFVVGCGLFFASRPVDTAQVAAHSAFVFSLFTNLWVVVPVIVVNAGAWLLPYRR